MIDFCKNLDNNSTLEYDNENRNASYGGGSVTASEMLTAAIKATNNTQESTAKNIGWIKQQLNTKLKNNTLRADEFLKLLDGIGVEFTMFIREKDIEVQVKQGEPLRHMVDGVLYNTATATALANDFYADGINKYTDGKARELLMDKEGRYFFAEYYCLKGTKDRIVPATPEEAADFVVKYGTDLNKAKVIE